MTPLEKRLIEDMKLFGYSKRTQDTYLYAVLGNIRVLRHRACLSLIYSCGLRISEAVSMQVSQIDSGPMVVHVRAAVEPGSLKPSGTFH
jgi:site-specific recombinase XerD